MIGNSDGAKVLNEVEERFRNEDLYYGRIGQVGFSAYVRGLPGLELAFRRKPRVVVCCMDEGTPKGVHVAGSGILLSGKELNWYFDRVKPTEITSHAGCGAAKLFAQSRGLDVRNADEIARIWAAEQASKRGLVHTHITHDQLRRPCAGHYARTLYYDATGTFNWPKVPGMPAGFVVSRKFLTPTYALREVEVAIGIALAKNSLLYASPEPFHLVAVAMTQPGLGKIMTELRTKIAVHGDRVQVSGFLHPHSRA